MEGVKGEHDTARLRSHVSLLGRLLGKVLVAEGGQELLELEESVRRRTTALRTRHDASSQAALDDELAGMELATTTNLIRAFALYFQLVNLAELEDRVSRTRELRDNSGKPLEGSFADLFERLAAEEELPAQPNGSAAAYDTPWTWSPS